MSKAVLVMDMPESCAGCVFCKGLNVCKMKSYMEKEKIFSIYTVDHYLFCNTKPDWCPLREMPEKMEVCGKYPQPDRIVPSYKIGWNACLDAIMGGDSDE